MRILLSFLALLTLVPGAALAEAAGSTAPQPMTAEAEFWYAVASVAMILSLAAAGWLVKRR